MHIFIDYLKLPEQSLSESFGVNPSDSNKFIISTGYKLIQQSKAFACQDGLMIVQQSDIHPDLVNLIIKPIKGLEISLGNVQYYVYRGIQKDSLIVDSKIISKNNAKKHSLIERIWENAESYWKQAKIPLDSDLSEGIIGYDSSLQNDVKIESIYNYFNENVSPICWNFIMPSWSVTSNTIHARKIDSRFISFEECLFSICFFSYESS